MSTSNLEAQHETIKTQKHLFQNHGNWSLIGGVITAAFVLGGVIIGGQVNSYHQAQHLIEMMSPAMQMLSFAAITATGTILALMLTLLGLIHQSELKFKKGFYEIILRITWLSTIDFICSVLLLALVGIPFGEANTEPTVWFNAMYYLLIFANALISGVLVAIILMLFDAIRGVIHTLKTE